MVHNVDPTEAASSFAQWIPAVRKELGSFESAAKKVMRDEDQVLGDLKAGRAKIVPMKIVYTVKPP